MKLIGTESLMGTVESELILDNIIESVDWTETKNYLAGSVSVTFQFSSFSEPPIVKPTITTTGAIITNTFYESEVWWDDASKTAHSATLTGYIDFNAANNNDLTYTGTFEKLTTTNYQYSSGELVRTYTLIGEDTPTNTFSVYFATLTSFPNFDKEEQYPVGRFGKILILQTLQNNRLYFKTKIVYRLDFNSGGLYAGFVYRSFRGTLAAQSYENSLSIGNNSKFILNSNELMQVDTKVGGVSIGTYIANNIIDHYKNGKQSVEVTVNVTDNDPLYKVDEIVTVLDCPIDEIDVTDQTQVNRHSIARYPDGTAKSFRITSAEFQYNGSFRQILKMIENIEK